MFFILSITPCNLLTFSFKVYTYFCMFTSNLSFSNYIVTRLLITLVATSCSSLIWFAHWTCFVPLPLYFSPIPPIEWTIISSVCYFTYQYSLFLYLNSLWGNPFPTSISLIPPCALGSLFTFDLPSSRPNVLPLFICPYLWSLVAIFACLHGVCYNEVCNCCFSSSTFFLPILV